VERKNCTLVEIARTMLDEHMTPRCFWAEAINTACYISNRFFLRSLLNLTLFELRFGRQPSVSHLRPFGFKCFILKHGNLDKFESRSSDRIFLGYTPHGRSYRVLNLKTNTIVKSCDMTFDETATCPHDVFESVGDKEIEESIFVEIRIYMASRVTKMNILLPRQLHYLGLFLLPLLKQRFLKLLPLPQQQYMH
jgi:hypothetical protein